jgi:hypothetical protein
MCAVTRFWKRASALVAALTVALALAAGGRADHEGGRTELDFLLYATTAGSTLESIDVHAGTSTVVETQAFLGALTYDFATNVLYAESARSFPYSIAQVEPKTGTATPLLLGVNTNNLAVRESTGMLYYIHFNYGTTSMPAGEFLHTVNLANNQDVPALRLTVPVAWQMGPTCMTFHPETGVAYVSLGLLDGSGVGMLATLNLTTGTFTPVCDAPSFQAIAAKPMTSLIDGSRGSEIWEVDTRNGHAHIVYTGGLFAYQGLAFLPHVAGNRD